MNRFKFQAYLEEFPFLRKIIGDINPDSIRIKRVDENLLKYVPRYYYWDGSLGQTERKTKIHFVLHDCIIDDAVMQEGERGSNYAHSQRREWEGETVLEAIDRHGVTDNIQFIVVEDFDYDNWEGGEYRDTYEVIIYKAPKDTTFGKEIEKAKARALAEVRAEADF